MKNKLFFIFLILFNVFVYASSFEEGKKAFYNAEFQKAIDILENYRTQLENLPTLPKDKLIETYLILAQSYIGLNKIDKAKIFFQKAIYLSPELELDESLYSPRVLDIFDRAKKEIIGSIYINTTPENAKVYINNKYVGLTPYQNNNIIIGKYLVFIQKENYKPIYLNVNISSDSLTKIEKKLQPLSSISQIEPKIIFTPPKNPVVGYPLIFNAYIIRTYKEGSFKLYYKFDSKSDNYKKK